MSNVRISESPSTLIEVQEADYEASLWITGSENGAQYSVQIERVGDEAQSKPLTFKDLLRVAGLAAHAEEYYEANS